MRLCHPSSIVPSDDRVILMSIFLYENAPLTCLNRMLFIKMLNFPTQRMLLPCNNIFLSAKQISQR